ncbi:MAG: hypothetical protein IJA27_07375 [Lachnospiraceae bacterium]|nr:hypothetical protein [Lachnospiraceae bacterium]
MNRINFIILKIMKSEDAVSKSTGMTLNEFPLEDLQIKRNTLQKKMQQLQSAGFVERGYKDMHSYTYYITEVGLNFLGK